MVKKVGYLETCVWLNVMGYVFQPYSLAQLFSHCLAYYFAYYGFCHLHAYYGFCRLHAYYGRADIALMSGLFMP